MRTLLGAYIGICGTAAGVAANVYQNPAFGFLTFVCVIMLVAATGIEEQSK